MDLPNLEGLGWQQDPWLLMELGAGDCEVGRARGLWLTGSMSRSHKRRSGFCRLGARAAYKTTGSQFHGVLRGCVHMGQGKVVNFLNYD